MIAAALMLIGCAVLIAAVQYASTVTHGRQIAALAAIHDEELARAHDDAADAENRLYLAEVDNAVLRDELHWSRLTIATLAARDDLSSVLGNGRAEVAGDNVVALRRGGA